MTTQSQSKLPYLIGLVLVVVVISVAAWQLLKGEEPIPIGERQVIDLPSPVVEETPTIEQTVEEPEI
ncbi:hypothetical protein, partial [Pseudoalteromonas sp. G4]|uniref:hypothetical protein n=1 Tax=Pseudoalteromonas sp. G4 TaxID=2992761 RepID=UPI00237E2C25